MAEEEETLVVSWGRGVNGELGRGELEEAGKVAVVTDLVGLRIVQLSAGFFHNAAVTAEGDLYTWGAGAGGQLGTGDGVGSARPLLVRSLRTHRRRACAAACGRTHTLVLSASGAVLACGRAARGQLGVALSAGSFTDAVEPRPIRFNPGGGGGGGGSGGGNGNGHVLAPGRGVRALSVGESHSLALTVSGGLYAWGNGAHGRLGLGGGGRTRTPSAGVKWRHAARALLLGGARRAGGGGGGGDGDSVAGSGGTGAHHSHHLAGGAGGAAGAAAVEWAPVRVQLPARHDRYDRYDRYAQHAAPSAAAAARCSGASASVGSAVGSAVLVALVCAGWRHSLAVTTSGLLFAWGSNDRGQLGVGASADALPRTRGGAQAECCRGTPTLVEALARETVVAIAAGGAHSLAASLHGALFSWGDDGDGQLGHGAARGRARRSLGAPTLVDGPPLGSVDGADGVDGADARPPLALRAGAAHSAVLTADGQLWLCGSNAYGQLGTQIAAGPREVAPAACTAGERGGGGGGVAAATTTCAQTPSGPGQLPSPAAAAGRAGWPAPRCSLSLPWSSPSFARVRLERLLSPGCAPNDVAARADAAGARRWRVRQVACGAWHSVALVTVARKSRAGECT